MVAYRRLHIARMQLEPVAHLNACLYQYEEATCKEGILVNKGEQKNQPRKITLILNLISLEFNVI